MRKILLTLILFFTFITVLNADDLKYRCDTKNNYRGYSVAYYMGNSSDGVSEKDWKAQFAEWKSNLEVNCYSAEPVRKINKEQKFLLKEALADWDDIEAGDYFGVEIRQQTTDKKALYVLIYFTSETEYIEEYYICMDK